MAYPSSPASTASIVPGGRLVQQTFGNGGAVGRGLDDDMNEVLPSPMAGSAGGGGAGGGGGGGGDVPLMAVAELDRR